MKTVLIGDIHGRTIWKDIVSEENPDRVIFIGDYFDSFDIPSIDQQYNFERILEFKRESSKEVILLIGNHDFHYMRDAGGELYSGFQSGVSFAISNILESNKHLLQMAYQFDNIICTHAGISLEWLSNNLEYHMDIEDINSENLCDVINDMWRYKPQSFRFSHSNEHHKSAMGNHPSFSPIWIRPDGLMRGNKSSWIEKELIQIVGHTQRKKIDIKGKSTGGRYYFIDALEWGQYLIHNNGEFNLGLYSMEE